MGSLSADSIRDNAVEGEVNDYRLAGGHTRMAPCQFNTYSLLGNSGRLFVFGGKL